MTDFPSGNTPETPAQLAEQLLAHLDRGESQAPDHAARRLILAIVGIPGSGKSTLAEQLADLVNAARGPATAAVVAMDGFHLRNAELDARGLRAVKGAPQTYAAQQMAELLQTIRSQQPGDPPIGVPVYSRVSHEPIPDALWVGPENRLILVEGQYLLLSEPPWDRIAACCDESWYLEIDREQSLERVWHRHIRGGNSEAQARQRIDENDRPNALRIEPCRGRADRVVRLVD